MISARPGVVPLVLVSGVVVAVAAGCAEGIWLPNLHNGLLALAFVLVGAYVLFQRPGHREGRVFLAAGVVEAVLFAGRQAGQPGTTDPAVWWVWFGVWPIALGIGVSTVAIICFPDGRPPSRRWRPVLAGIVAVAVVCSAVSALWPVEYASAGVTAAHPFGLPGAGVAESVWAPVAHTAYPAFQLAWVVAVVARWRRAGPVMRVQLAWVGMAAAVSAVLLVVGQLGWGTPRAGLLSAALVPLAAGWAIVRGQQLAAYSALSWLSRRGPGSEALADDLARAAADALDAPGAVVWIGDADDLHPAGAHPVAANGVGGPDGIGGPGGDGVAPSSLVALEGTVRAVERGGVVIGAISVHRTDPPSRAQERVLADLTAQAALLIEHLDLADLVARRRAAAGMERLSPREREVLELMAEGLSNAAICERLHLSVKTVEPVIGTIFAKLGFSADAGSNRRVLAVRAWMRAKS